MCVTLTFVSLHCDQHAFTSALQSYPCFFCFLYLYSTCTCIKSDRVVRNTGVPQGDSPVSLPLHPPHHRLQVLPPSEGFWWLSCGWWIRKGEDAKYRAVESNSWCLLNIMKTKELEMGFRREKTSLTPFWIQGVSVNRVDNYKYNLNSNEVGMLCKM